MSSNSSRKNRTRRQVRRVQNKGFRSAEKQVVREQRPYSRSVGLDWGGPRQHRHLPLPDATTRGPAKKAKPRKAKEKCPANRTHEWYKEEVVTRSRFLMPGGRWFSRYPEDYWVTSISTDQVWTCIHCFKAKVVRHRHEYQHEPPKESA